MTSEVLIVMARLPVAGRAKTRLIPVLGPDAAAELHRELVAHTLDAVDALAQSRPVRVIIAVDAPPHAAAAEFGPHRDYAEQPEGDLGARMAEAFDAAFADGAPSALAIGTDCPGLDAATLGSAFDALDSADVVLGPATDGGYYLIGLRASAWGRGRDAAFADVPWSSRDTARVTRARLVSAGLTLAELVELQDVDEPADLDAWDALGREPSRE